MRISRLRHSQLILAITILLSFEDALTTQSSPIESNNDIYHLHKCFCEASQVYVDGSCIYQETTFNLIVDNLHRTTKKLKSSKAKNVTIYDVTCPAGSFQLSLPGDQFAFLGDGSIMHIMSEVNLHFDQYCYEHYMNEQKEIYSEIKLCTKVPNVQTCCQEPTCENSTQTTLTIPVWIGNTLKNIPAVGYPTQFECEDDTNMTVALLSYYSPQGARLEYTREGPILSYGTLHQSEAELFDSGQYCITQYSWANFSPEVTFCFRDPQKMYKSIYNETCADSLCMSKCCSEGMLFNFDELGCAPGSEAEIWKPHFYSSDTFQEVDVIYNKSSYHMFHGYPICGNGSYFLDPEDYTKTIIKLLDNGNLYEESGHTSWEPLNYCIDNFKESNRITEKALVCFKVVEQQEELCDQTTNIVYPILLILSTICLALTLVVYLFVPDLSAKIQGKCLVSSIFALIGAYICLIVAQLAHSQISMTGCSVLALFLQFFFLASFFWLNVMSFDIWQTFRCLKIKKGSSASSRRRFITYSIYSWGCPLVIVVVTAVMQFLPEQEDEGDIIRPKFTETSCFFTNTDQRASWAYFYGFITIILAFNCFFFLHLAWILYKAQKIAENTLGRRNQQYQEWAKLYFKLFIVMGVTWVFEVISYVEGSCSLWLVTDIINTLRGVFIFVIFICKQDTLRKIRTRGSPAISSIRTTFATSSSFFSRSSKRASSLYNSEPACPRPTATEETKFLQESEAK